MAHPLSFAVKFEFLLAYVPCQKPTPYSFEKRNFRFPHHRFGTAEKCSCLDEPKYTSIQASQIHQDAALQHIATTLQKANIIGDDDRWISSKEGKSENLQTWSIRRNDNARLIDNIDRKYSHFGVEISTPAFYYTQAALCHIEAFCQLMANTYLILTNPSCGMTITVGNGLQGFRFFDVRNLAMLFWAYENQFNSLLKIPRTDATWNPSMRDNSNLQADYQLSHQGRRATPAEGISQILKTRDLSELLLLIGHKDAKTHSDFNFSHFYHTENTGKPGEKNSKWRERIELRGQVATFVSEEVVNCIEMWVGIVQFMLHDMRHQQLRGIIGLARTFETWEKLGDGEDAAREEAYGPILAESKFNIIDLLQFCGLHQQARYYSDKWVQHSPRLQRRRVFDFSGYASSTKAAEEKDMVRWGGSDASTVIDVKTNPSITRIELILNSEDKNNTAVTSTILDHDPPDLLPKNLERLQITSTQIRKLTPASDLDAEEHCLEAKIAQEEAYLAQHNKLVKAKRMRDTWRVKMLQRCFQQEIELALAAPSEKQRLADVQWRERLGIMKGLGVREIMGVENPFECNGGVDRTVGWEDMISPRCTVFQKAV